MKSCYLYSFYKEVQVKDRGMQMQNHVVIFFPYKTHTEIELQLRGYFNNNTLPDQLIVICLDFNKDIIGPVSYTHLRAHETRIGISVWGVGL